MKTFDHAEPSADAGFQEGQHPRDRAGKFAKSAQHHEAMARGHKDAAEAHGEPKPGSHEHARQGRHLEAMRNHQDAAQAFRQAQREANQRWSNDTAHLEDRARHAAEHAEEHEKLHGIDDVLPKHKPGETWYDNRDPSGPWFLQTTTGHVEGYKTSAEVELAATAERGSAELVAEGMQHKPSPPLVLDQTLGNVGLTRRQKVRLDDTLGERRARAAAAMYHRDMEAEHKADAEKANAEGDLAGYTSHKAARYAHQEAAEHHEAAGKDKAKLKRARELSQIAEEYSERIVHTGSRRNADADPKGNAAMTTADAGKFDEGKHKRDHGRFAKTRGAMPATGPGMTIKRVGRNAYDLEHKDGKHDFHVERSGGQWNLHHFDSKKKDPDEAHIGSHEHGSLEDAIGHAHELAGEEAPPKGLSKDEHKRLDELGEKWGSGEASRDEIREYKTLFRQHIKSGGTVDADWDEGKHPRDKGKFASKPGAGATHHEFAEHHMAMAQQHIAEAGRHARTGASGLVQKHLAASQAHIDAHGLHSQANLHGDDVKARAHAASDKAHEATDDATASRPDHRQLATEGNAHHSMLQGHEVGNHVDFYNGEGEKRYGKVIKRTQNEVHYRDSSNGEVTKHFIVGKPATARISGQATPIGQHSAKIVKDSFEGYDKNVRGHLSSRMVESSADPHEIADRRAGEIKGMHAAGIAPSEAARRLHKSQALPTKNEGYGFHGAMRGDSGGLGKDQAAQRFAAVSSHLQTVHGLSPHEARDFLDSRMGRHLGDEIGGTKDPEAVQWRGGLGATVRDWKRERKAEGKKQHDHALQQNRHHNAEAAKHPEGSDAHLSHRKAAANYSHAALAYASGDHETGASAMEAAEHHASEAARFKPPTGDAIPFDESKHKRDHGKFAHTAGAPAMPTLNHPAYHQQTKLRGYNAAVNVHQAVSVKDRAKLLMQHHPAWTHDDHKRLAEQHRAAATHHQTEHSKAFHKAIRDKFGRDPSLSEGDYKISTIGRDDFDDATKEKLREHGHAGSAHSRLAEAHAEAAKKTKPSPEATSNERQERILAKSKDHQFYADRHEKAAANHDAEAARHQKLSNEAGENIAGPNRQAADAHTMAAIAHRKAIKARNHAVENPDAYENHVKAYGASDKAFAASAVASDRVQAAERHAKQSAGRAASPEEHEEGIYRHLEEKHGFDRGDAQGLVEGQEMQGKFSVHASHAAGMTPQEAAEHVLKLATPAKK